MKELLHEKLNISVQVEEEKVTMKWLGESREIDPSLFLDPYINEFVKELSNEKGKILDVDFSRLDTMNSSTVKPILLFIRMLEENSIKTEIIYDESIFWQKASFASLGVITLSYNFVKVRALRKQNI